MNELVLLKLIMLELMFVEGKKIRRLQRILHQLLQSFLLIQIKKLAPKEWQQF